MSKGKCLKCGQEIQGLKVALWNPFTKVVECNYDFQCAMEVTEERRRRTGSKPYGTTN